jgi:hypothetical protein
MISKDELEEIMLVADYALVGILIALISFTLPIPPQAQITIGFIVCIIFGLATIK